MQVGNSHLFIDCFGKYSLKICQLGCPVSLLVMKAVLHLRTSLHIDMHMGSPESSLKSLNLKLFHLILQMNQ